MSGVLVEAWGAGRVAITSDQPQFSDFDPDFCRRVPRGDGAVDALANEFRRLYRDVDELVAAGRRARQLIETTYSVSSVAAQYGELIEELAKRPRRRPLEGLNVLGSWGTSSGLVEAARRLTLGLLAAGEALALPRDFSLATYSLDNVPVVFASVPRDPAYAVSLITANVNEWHEVPAELRQRGRPGHYTIALWFYEFPDLPRVLAERVDQVDEIWVGSDFAAETFRRYANVPVVTVPAIVTRRECVTDVATTRRRWGLTAHGPLVFFSFELRQWLAAQEPAGRDRGLP
jgi:hypothetical protein